MESAAARIDQKINKLGDWRGKTPAESPRHHSHRPPDIVEQVKWRGTPAFSHSGFPA